MAVFSLVSASVVTAYLGTGIYVLVKNPRAEINRLFFALALVLTLWALGTHFFNHVSSIEEGWGVFGLFSFAWFFAPPLLLHFFLRLTTGRIHPPWLMIYAPAVLLCAATIVDRSAIIDTARPLSLGWEIVYNTDSFWYYFNVANYTVCILHSIVLVVRWRLRADSGRARRQAAVILVSLIPPMIIGTLVGTLFPMMGIGSLPPLGYILFSFWMFGIGYAVARYELMALTPAAAAEELISRVRDAVILFDREKTIRRVNAVAESFCERREPELVGMLMEEIVAPQALWRQLREGMDFQAAIRARGGELIPLRASLSAIHDARREVIGYLFAGQDLRPAQTLVREKELREQLGESCRSLEVNLQNALFQVGGLAHDFNNMLTAILGNVTLGRMQALNSDERIFESLNNAEKACQRARDLTRRLFIQTTRETVEKKNTNFADVLDESLQLAAAAGIRGLCVDVQSGLWPVHADDFRISQVFFNLIQNGHQAIGGCGGRIEVRLKNVVIGAGDGSCARLPLPERPGCYVAVVISDNGCGMSPELEARIFDPYFTTHGQGIGLGLTLVRSIVADHAGEIFVRSREGVGTSFYLYFPAVPTTMSVPAPDCRNPP